MTHPLATLSREELRGWIACTRHMAALSVRLGAFDPTMLVMEELQEVAQGLVDRTAPTPADTPQAQQQADKKPEPANVSEFSRIYARMFAPPGARTVAHPAGPMQICRDADAECIAGCTFQQDGQCGRDKAAALAAAASDEAQQQAAGTYRETEPASQAQGQRWYRFLGTEVPFATLAEAMEASDGGPLAIESSEWPGPRWVVLVPCADGHNEIATADTEQDALAFLASEAEEEKAQTGLADAVADNLAEQAEKTSTTEEAHVETTEASAGTPREQAHALFLEGLKPSEIAAKLNIPKGSVSAWASMHGWREELAELKASQAKQATPPPVITTAFIPLTTEEMHNLRESFRKKEFGVTWLAEEYGMPPDKAQEIVDQLRAEQAQKKAKAA